MSVTTSALKRSSVLLYLQLFVGGHMSCLRYLCLFVHNGVQHISWCVFWFVFLRLVYPMLPVSLDCPFLIAPSVFSNHLFNHLDSYYILLKSDMHRISFKVQCFWYLDYLFLFHNKNNIKINNKCKQFNISSLTLNIYICLVFLKLINK